jgi:2-methylcitrate dehydratase PrpD
VTADDPYRALSGLTAAATKFTVGLTFADLPADVLHIARRCVLDGLAVALAGSEQHGMKPLLSYIDRIGGRAEAPVLGSPDRSVPAHLAALWFGTAGHAMDWDDTQLAEGPGRPYGLLMHPTMPPLAAALITAEAVKAETGQPVDGKRFLTAFCAGFEVGCKIAEAIEPDHYMRGFHTSGTIGTFAAAAAAANMLRLGPVETARALGMAASAASGVRANFGTMTKPLHVGRAAENGVTAAFMAREGFTANQEALDGKWGFLAIAGPGGDAGLVRDRFGAPMTMVQPGISIKPYPSGVLTHPSMDALRFLMAEKGLKPEDIAHIELRAGSNVLGPIRFRIAKSELEGKFSFAFLLSAIALRGAAGKAEFTDEFVLSAACQDMQARVDTVFDQDIENMGWDRIRSRIVVTLRSGETHERWADENYRGSPHNPLSDRELEGKFRDCAAGLLDEPAIQRLFGHVWALETLPDAGVLLGDLSWMGPRP